MAAPPAAVTTAHTYVIPPHQTAFPVWLQRRPIAPVGAFAHTVRFRLVWPPAPGAPVPFIGHAFRHGALPEWVPESTTVHALFGFVTPALHHVLDAYAAVAGVTGLSVQIAIACRFQEGAGGPRQERVVEMDATNLIGHVALRRNWRLHAAHLLDWFDHRVDQFEQSGRMQLVGIESVYVSMVPNPGLLVGSYVPLPGLFKQRHGNWVWNPRTYQDNCFQVCMLHAVFGPLKDGHTNRTAPYLGLLHAPVPESCTKARPGSLLSFPPLTHRIEGEYKALDRALDEFESANPDTAVNVYLPCGLDIVPYRVSTRIQETQLNVTHLLMLTNSADSKCHFAVLRSIGPFLRRSQHSGGPSPRICFHCLTICKDAEHWTWHRTLGCDTRPCAVPVMPRPHSEFSKESILDLPQKQRRRPYVAYADFEALLPPPDDDRDTWIKQTHIPCSWAYVVVDEQGHVVGSDSYTLRKTDEPAVALLLVSLLQTRERLQQLLRARVEHCFAPHWDTDEWTYLQKYEFQQHTCGYCHGTFELFFRSLNQRIVRNGGRVDARMERLSRNTQAKYRPIRFRVNVDARWQWMHAGCKARFSWQDYVLPVFFHNLRGYDGHFLISHLFESETWCQQEEPSDLYEYAVDDLDAETRMLQLPDTLTLQRDFHAMEHERAEWSVPKIIAKTSESYLAFTYRKLRFVDTLQFFGPGMSLDKLSKTFLQRESTRTVFKHRIFPILLHWRDRCSSVRAPHVFQDQTTWLLTSLGETPLPSDVHAQLDCLLQKGVYPYGHMVSPASFDEPSLPPPAAFWDALTQTDVSPLDYAHAQRVWSLFQCRTMADYHCIYLFTDVLLLMGAFEAFRDTLFRDFQLDMTHYFTLPGYSLDAALTHTNVRLGVVSDFEMMRFMDSAVRGGISFAHGFERARNIACPLLEDDEFPSSPDDRWLTYMDATNLYGWAMSQPLPHGEYAWVSESELANWNADLPTFFQRLIEHEERSEDAYILEVDGYTPTQLHFQLRHLPLCPIARPVDPSEWSPHQRQVYGSLYGAVPAHSNQTKLILDFHPRVQYRIHSAECALYVRLGFVVTRIHQAVRFRQSRWLAPYISVNTEGRKVAKERGDVMMDLGRKLINNANYGKWLENLDRQGDFRVTFSPTQFAKWCRSPRTLRWKEFPTCRMAAVAQVRNKIVYRRPRVIGAAILAWSKVRMYRFWYDAIQPCWPLPSHRLRLVMMDTDSFCFAVSTYGFWSDVQRLEPWLETSNLPTSHPLYSHERFLEPGFFKFEFGDRTVVEFCGIRSKMYSLKLWDTTLDAFVEKHTAKGVRSNAQKMNASGFLQHADYRARLFSPSLDLQSHVITQRMIRSYEHVLSTVEQVKVGLVPFDDKWFYIDSLHSVPYGYAPDVVEPDVEPNTNADVPHDDEVPDAPMSPLYESNAWM